MARGPKNKPSNLKLIENTARPGRENVDEPKVAPALPAAPGFLSDPAREEWDRVVDELYNCGVLTNLDRAALAAYCQAYGRWVQAEMGLAKFAEKDRATFGIMLKTQSGNAIQNPLVGAANKAAADMVRYAAEFGMTPASRARVKAGDNEQDEDPAARFFS